MRFKDAYHYMKWGEKIKLPEWKSYLYWDNLRETIIITTEDLDEIDIYDIPDLDYIIGFMNRDDWIITDL